MPISTAVLIGIRQMIITLQFRCCWNAGGAFRHLFFGFVSTESGKVSPASAYTFLSERLQISDRTTEDQSVDIVGTLIGVHSLEVLRMAHDVVLNLNPVSAVHVS